MAGASECRAHALAWVGWDKYWDGMAWVMGWERDSLLAENGREAKVER